MSTKKIDPNGAQPTDPPWARLLFLVVQGREGQWWRAILLLVPLLLLVIALVVLIVMIMAGALQPLSGWISAGAGSLIAAGAVAWYQRRRSSLRSGGG